MNKTAIALLGFLLTATLTAQTAVPPNPHSYDFSAASAAINTAIAQKKLPGAILVIGHNGKVVFEQAYGVRKYANEPGLDGKPSPAEPMTLDTIFDMASLTKCLATATAVMQLVEAGQDRLRRARHKIPSRIRRHSQRKLHAHPQPKLRHHSRPKLHAHPQHKPCHSPERQRRDDIPAWGAAPGAGPK